MKGQTRTLVGHLAPDRGRPPPGGRAGAVTTADSGGRSRTGLCATDKSVRISYRVPGTPSR